MNHRTLLALSSTLAFALVGCGGSDSDQGAQQPAPEDLAPPAVGTQIKSTKVKLEAGGERYSCWSFQLPTDKDLPLIQLEQQVAAKGVHHYAVFTSAKAYDPAEAGPYDCFSMGIEWGLVSGGGVGTPGVTFPEGTAMTLAAGQHIILQLHLLNPGTDTLEIPETRINLVGAPKGDGLQPVGLIVAGTLDISIPAHSKDLKVEGGCALDASLPNIFAVFPHMHQLGKRIRVDLAPAGGTASTLVDDPWDFGDQGLFPVKGTAAKGDQVKVTCTYDNPSDKDVSFGLHTGDEMCLEVLYHYPAAKPSAYCGLQ